MATFTLIASSTVGSGGATSITFSSIPSTYTDLMIYMSIRSTRTGVNFDSIGYRFNASTSGYQTRYIYGDGSSASSGADTTFSPAGQVYGRFDGGAINAGNTTSNTFTSIGLYIPNYAGSTNKSFSFEIAAENNATAGALEVAAGLWSNTAAITEIQFRDNNLGNIAEHSTAYLYGVSNA
jgi:hypothetical protein